MLTVFFRDISPDHFTQPTKMPRKQSSPSLAFACQIFSLSKIQMQNIADQTLKDGLNYKSILLFFTNTIFSKKNTEGVNNA